MYIAQPRIILYCINFLRYALRRALSSALSDLSLSAREPYAFRGEPYA